MRLIKFVVLMSILIYLSPEDINAQEQKISPIIISELLANPAGTDKDFEWIELHNLTEEIVELNNAKIDGKVIPASSIEPNGFLIIANSPNSIKELFPEVGNIVQTSITLNNTSDTVRLEFEDFVDIVEYKDPTENKSIERSNPNCKDIWTSHHSSNSISSINSNWEEYCENDQLKLSSSLNGVDYIEGLVGIELKPINFKINNENISSIKWFYNGNEYFTNSIQIQSLTSPEIFLEILYSNGKKVDTTLTIKVYKPIVINEVMSDPDGVDTGKEWIEILSENDINDWMLADLTTEISITNNETSLYKVVYPTFTINNSDEIIYLKSPEGLVVDTFKIISSQSGLTNCLINNSNDTCIPTIGGENKTHKSDLLVSTIAAAKQKEEELVLISGQITLIRDKFFYLQDKTGGIKVSHSQSNINPGNYIITGLIKESRGEKYISLEDIKPIENNFTNNPHKVSLIEEIHEGLLIEVTGNVLSSSSNSIILSNGNTEYRILLEGIKIDKKKNNLFKVIGVVSQWGYEDDNSPYYRIFIKEIKLLKTFSITKKETAKLITQKSEKLDEIKWELKEYKLTDEVIFDNDNSSQFNPGYLLIYLASFMKGLMTILNKNYLLEIVKLIY